MNWYAKISTIRDLIEIIYGTLKSGFFVNKNKNFLPLPLKQPKTLGEGERLIFCSYFLHHFKFS
jgi:hypothetical protein